MAMWQPRQSAVKEILKMSAIRPMNALHCVGQNDVQTLRIICTSAGKNLCNLEELDKYGNTALLKACYLGRLECAALLLSNGADIYAINYFGQNALTLATYAGHKLLVLELLQYRTYRDFNLSSLIPAICVAAMKQHKELENYFRCLDPKNKKTITTVHGLGVNNIKHMVTAKTVRKQQLFN